MWQTTVARLPRNAHARFNFARALDVRGAHAAALREYDFVESIWANAVERIQSGRIPCDRARPDTARARAARAPLAPPLLFLTVGVCGGFVAQVRRETLRPGRGRRPADAVAGARARGRAAAVRGRAQDRGERPPLFLSRRRRISRCESRSPRESPPEDAKPPPPLVSRRRAPSSTSRPTPRSRSLATRPRATRCPPSARRPSACARCSTRTTR